MAGSDPSLGAPSRVLACIRRGTGLLQRQQHRSSHTSGKQRFAPDRGGFSVFLHTTGKIGVVGVVGVFEAVDGVLRHVRHLGSDAGAEETRTSSKRPRKHSPGLMYVLYTTQQRTGDGKGRGARGQGSAARCLWDSLGLDGLPHQKGKKYSVITAQATLDGFSWVAAHQMHARPK